MKTFSTILVLCVALGVSLGACGSELSHEAPYDTQSPVSKQQKGVIKGVVALKGENDASQVSVNAVGAGFSIDAQTLADGSFTLAPVTPGPLLLSFTFRGFESEALNTRLDIGETLTLGTITLEPKTVTVSGSAVAKLDVGAADQEGGVALDISRTGGVKAAVSGAPGYRAAAEVTASAVPATFFVVSDPSGNYSIALPAGVYSISASKDGVSAEPVEVKVTGDESVTVEPITVLPVTGFLTIVGTYGAGSPYAAASYAYASTRDVTLLLSGFNAATMRLGEDVGGGCLYGDAIAYVAVMPLSLSAGDGTRTLCVRYTGADGAESGDITATIVLDESPPTDLLLDTQSGLYELRDSSLMLVLGADDAVSGVDSVELAEEPTFTLAAENGMRQVLRYELVGLSEGDKTIYARYRDKAGNAAVAQLAVTRDTTAPVGSVQVAGGAEYVATQFVTVATQASPDTAKILLSNDPGFAIATEFAYSPALVWAVSSSEGPQRVYAKFTDRAGNVSSVYSDAVTYDASAPIVASFSLDVTVSTTELNLEWAPSLLAGAIGYNWYRILDGVVTLGGNTSATSATVIDPLPGETYAVATRFAGGLESALSSPAVEKGAPERTKAILVVDDDAGTNAVERNLIPLLTAAGFSFDVVTVAAGSGGPALADLSPYATVIWSTGEATTAPVVGGSDREVLQEYLESGGNLFMLTPDGLADPYSAAFLRNWSHSGATVADIFEVSHLYGVDGDVVSAGVDFAVGPPMSGVDAVSGSPLAAEWLAAGKPVAIRYPSAGAAAYRFAWAAVPTTGLYRRAVAEVNTTSYDLPFSGNDLTLEDDDAVRIDLPFNVRFGTMASDSVWVSSNGIVSFVTGVTSPEPFDPFPSLVPSTPLIAPLWADLDPSAATGMGRVYFTEETDVVSIVWDGVSNKFGGVVTTAVRLHRDGNIDLLVLDAEVGPGRFAAGSFQDGTGRSYLEMGFPFDVGGTSDCTWAPCGFDSFPISIRVYRDTVTEAVPLARRLVRWLTPPTAVRTVPMRYYTLNSSVSDAVEMRVSTDGVLDTEPWDPYVSALPVSYDDADGAKTAKVVYRDRAGNTSESVTDTVTLDTDAPRVSAVILTDASNGSNAYTRTRTVTMELIGTATVSDFMRASESPVFVDAGWAPFVKSSTFTLSEGDADKLVYVWVKDPNGNVSAPAVGSISVDTESPSTHAVADRVANRSPLYVNASYMEIESNDAFASLPAGAKLDITNDIPVTVKSVPFSLDFYGRASSKIIIVKNGAAALSFSPGGDEGSDITRDETDREAVFASELMVAPLYQVIAFTRPEHGVYYAEDATSVVIRWSGVNPRSQTPINTAVRLYDSGLITFLYGNGNFDLQALVGISKGDGKNRLRSGYSEARFLPNARSVSYVPNQSDVESVRLYYRYHHATGPGAWTSAGSPVNDVFEAIAFYPPHGPGVYDFYTEGTDSAGNAETAPDQQDVLVYFDDAPPEPPSRVRAEADDDSVFVAWDASLSPDVVGYRVYYGEDGDLSGTDAVEGASPIEVPAESFTRLSGFEIGRRTYVGVTAVDHVGNESAMPGGASVVPPRAIRKLATVAGFPHHSARLRDESLFIASTTGSGNYFSWYGLANPGAPELFSRVQNYSPGMVVYDGYAYGRGVSYAVDTLGAFDKQLFEYQGAWYMTPVTHGAMLLFEDLGNDTSMLKVNNLASGTPFNIAPLGKPLALIGDSSATFVFASDNCASGSCSDSYAWSITFGSAGSMHFAGGMNFSYGVKAADLADGLLATGRDWDTSGGRLEIYDAADPAAPSLLFSGTEQMPLTMRWVGDRLAFADYFGLNLLNASDVTEPTGESAVSVGGYPLGLEFSRNLGVVGHSSGFDVFEFGELLPSNFSSTEVPLAGQISAMATRGDYVYVAQETSLDIFDISAVDTAGPRLVAQYTPFVATALAALGNYLYALNEQGRLYVFDVRNPQNPVRIWHEPDGGQYWPGGSLVVFGSTIFLLDRAYDMRNPASPSLLGEYASENLRMLRAGGGLLYGAAVTATLAGVDYYELRVYDPSAASEDIPRIGSYGAAVSHLTDFVVDGRLVYAYLAAPVGKLLAIDVSDPVAPVLRGEYDSGSLGWAPNNRFLAASRGFLYLVSNSEQPTTLMQIDMRAATPMVAFAFQPLTFEYLAGPPVVSSRGYVFAAGSRSLRAFRTSSNVPVLESRSSSLLGGASKVALGGRFGYFAVDSELWRIERRAPALILNALGAGEVALVKRGDRLSIYDPPGIPASSLTADASGVINLGAETLGSLCQKLSETGRIYCRLAGWASDSTYSTVQSVRLLDNAGIRLKNDASGSVLQTDSLRLPRTTPALVLPGPITALRYDGDLLFAGVSGASGGLYVIDPLTMTSTRHAVGEVFDVQVRDRAAFIAGSTAVTAYRWSTKQTLSTMPVGSPARFVNLNDTRLVYPGNLTNAVRVSAIGPTGALGATMLFQLAGPPIRTALPIGDGKLVMASDDGAVLLWTYKLPTSEYNFEGYLEFGDLNFLKHVYGRLLMGVGGELLIVDVGSLPYNVAVRVLTVQGGQVLDADVLGDVMAVAAGPAGAVAYRLK